MTPDELNKRLAQLLGWETEGYRDGYGGPPHDTAPERIPDYANDLDAVHEVEMGLKGEDMERYSITLHTLRIEQGIPTHTDGWRNLGMLSATALQRTEALIRTLEANH